MQIKKGRHYCFTWRRLQPFATKREGSLMIPLENWYDKSFVKHSGWNKLTGVGQIFGVHQNSGRLVWQPNFNKPGYFKIAGYVYSNGIRTDSIFANIKAGEWVNYRVAHNGRWEFMINGVTIRMTGIKPCLPIKLFPYFGGKDKAYYTMRFYETAHKNN
tara:strand:- start:1508 stop:1984 length:477 start_codon:yes stop_codon:yes gene_type:complete